MDYLYNVKKQEDIEIGDIIFTELDENNRPICVYIVLDNSNLDNIVVFSLNDKELLDDKLTLSSHNHIYYLGSIFQKLALKELMKNVQKRYVWLGIEYDLIKVLINLLDGTVERYNYETEEWEYLDDELEDNGYMMILTFNNNISFRINLTNLKVQIMNGHTLKFRNYNNYLLGLEGQYVFNAENELELISRDKLKEQESGDEYGKE